MEAYYSLQTNTGRPGDIVPNTNLLLNLPLVQYLPLQNFTIKDQHLLKPPPVMGASEYYIITNATISRRRDFLFTYIAINWKIIYE